MRVELHTRGQTISVDRARIHIVGEPTPQAAPGAAPYATAKTPRAEVGATPMYGAATPMYGSQTPMYGSQV